MQTGNSEGGNCPNCEHFKRSLNRVLSERDQALIDGERLTELENQVQDLLSSLGHMAWCSTCAENRWSECEGGRRALALMEKIGNQTVK